MNNKFGWAFRLSQSQLEELFKEAVFFFDTNVLLNVYRVNDAIAHKVIDAMTQFKGRILITHHVAVEYHWNVIELVADRIASVQKQIHSLTVDNLYKKVYNEGLISYIPSDEQVELKAKLQEFCDASIQLLNERKSAYEDEFNSMTLSNLICSKLTGCLLEPLTNEEYSDLRNNFAQRAADKIPPGYLDNTNEKKNKKHEGISNEAGDYIIWEEILIWAKKEKKDVIFVSDDLKEDWIWSCHGFRIGPRWELKKQFFNETEGKCFHILTLDKFLELTENLTPEEIEKVRDAVRTPVTKTDPIKKSHSDEDIDMHSDLKKIDSVTSDIKLSKSLF